MELGLGYILAYNPTNGTVDIRSANGTNYTALPFDSSLNFYATPVLPVLRNTEASSNSSVDTHIIKVGSFVMYVKFSDTNIRIIRMFNDDQDILKNYSGHATRLIHGTIQDSLLASLQDGEALVMAPGRNIEVRPDVYERQVGAWMLFKNSGDAILSNADSSCEMFVSYAGHFEITATQYRLLGADTRVEEADDGTLYITSGESRGTPVTFSLSKDAVASLTSGSSSLTLNPTDCSIAAGTIALSGGNSVEVSTDVFSVSAKSVEVVAVNADVDVAEALTVSAAEASISIVGHATVSANSSSTYTATTAKTEANTLEVIAGEAIMVTAPRHELTVGETGTRLLIDGEAKLTIIVGDTSVEISKDGVIILPAAGKFVCVGSTLAAQPVLYGNPTSPTPSILLKVGG